MLATEKITELITFAYNSIAGQYQDTYAENDDYDLKYVERFLALLNGNKVIDLGCGTGMVLAHLASKGFKTIGVDSSENMLDIAKRNYPAYCFRQLDILNLPSNFGFFDGAILSYVVNHFNDEMLSKLKEKIDGLLLANGVVYIAAHIGKGEKVLPDPLNPDIQLYHHFLSIEKLDNLFSNYNRVFFDTRASFGEEEFLCDKMFVAYRKKV